MTSALKAEAALNDLNDSRAFEQLANDLKALRRKLDAEQATHGTRWDYLHWLIERTLYLDPLGTFQTQRQILVKLDEVYIPLRAQRDKTPGEMDRRLLEKELAQLRYLALKHAQALYAGRSEQGTDLGTVRFPILIRIADYAEHGLPRGQSLSSYLADYYAMHECPKFGLADLLGHCQALLLCPLNAVKKELACRASLCQFYAMLLLLVDLTNAAPGIITWNKHQC